MIELDQLRTAIPDAAVITDPDVIAAYRHDETPALTPGQPCCVVLARTTQHVSAALSWAQQHRVPVCATGRGHRPGGRGYRDRLLPGAVDRPDGGDPGARPRQ